MEQVKDIGNFCRKYFKDHFSGLAEAASHYECSTAFVSAVQTGEKSPTKAMQSDMGIESARVTVYFKV